MTSASHIVSKRILANLSPLVIGLWFVLACILAFVGMSAANTYNKSKALMVERSTSFAQLVAARDQFVFSYALDLVEEIEELLKPDDLSRAASRERKEDVEKKLISHWRRMPGTQIFAITDANGHSLYSYAPSGGHPRDISNTDFFSELKNSATPSVIGSSGADIVNLGNAIPVARKIVVGGKLMGVVYLTLSVPDVFFPFYASLDLGKETAVKMRTSSRLVTRFPVGESIPGQALPLESNPITKQIEQGIQRGTVQFVSSIDGIERHYSFERIGSSRFYSVIAISVAESMRAARQEVMAAIAVGLAAFLAAVLATIGLQRTVRHRNQAQWIAHHDVLTGLKNRHYLTDLFPELASIAKHKGSQLGFVVADIDNFRLVNDSIGYSGGDKLLIEIANRFLSAVQDEAIVIRFGSDKFVILHPINKGDPKHVLESVCWGLQDALRNPIVYKNLPVSIGVSIGAAIFPFHGNTLDEISHCADIAMYRGKSFGKGSYTIYYPGLEDGLATTDLSLSSTLAQAFDNNEFQIFFEPCIDIKTGKPTTAEVLLRWKKEDGSILSAQQFIHVAEQSGLIIKIGKWIVLETCRVAARWKSAGLPPLAFSINISALQFSQTDFASHLTEMLRFHNLPAEILQLEIAEPVMMSNDEVTQERIKRLNEIGIKFAIDDFGTGHSSLSCLYKHDISTIKIDRFFPEKAARDPRLRPLIAAIIEMAHAMLMKVVAEGVETNEALEFLSSIGCDEAQGYLFTRPLSQDGLIEFVREFEFKAYP